MDEGLLRATQEVKPTPDPTVMTTEQLIRTTEWLKTWVEARFDVVSERLDGIDLATEVWRRETELRLPRELDRAVAHIREVLDERTAGVQRQFAERDLHAEREARDARLAVEAAFAAQKEAAGEQRKSSSLAIEKSETATTEAINKLGDLFRSTTDALSDKIDDVKDRVTNIESAKAGATEVRSGVSATYGLAIAFAAVLIGVVSVLANVLTK